jgi:hypothetical protein
MPKMLRTLGTRCVVFRIRFPTDRDRIEGNYLLATQSVVRRLCGQVFEVSEAALELLDDHQIPYQVLPIPEPAVSGQLVAG